MTWTPPAFDPLGECTCTQRHSPKLMVVESHHILPVSWGGPDVAGNKVRVCPNTHYGTHALLNEYVRNQGKLPPSILSMYTAPVRLLAKMAWDSKQPGHPTPFWSPEPTQRQQQPDRTPGAE